MRKLLFIMADRPSLLAAKGELPDRYYNPGDLFDEVHLLTTTNDDTGCEALGGVAGSARLYVHRLWTGADLVNVAASPLLRRRWTRRAVVLARRIGPDLVRSGDRLTGYLAAHIQDALRVPFVLSLHLERDHYRRSLPWGPKRLLLTYERRYARYAFPRADAVVVVYRSLIPFAQEYGARRIELIYNVVCPGEPPAKTDYGLTGDKPTIVSVGRHTHGKVCEALVRAVAGMDVRLTLIGDGPRRQELESLAQRLGADERIRFEPAVLNADLVQALPTFDAFAVHCDFPGIPKAVMEAMWAGLPIVINRNPTQPVPELESDGMIQVENTPQSYAAALQRLFSSHEERRRTGQAARLYAERTFHPARMEARAAELYRELVPELRGAKTA